MNLPSCLGKIFCSFSHQWGEMRKNEYNFSKVLIKKITQEKSFQKSKFHKAQRIISKRLKYFLGLISLIFAWTPQWILATYAASFILDGGRGLWNNNPIPWSYFLCILQQFFWKYENDSFISILPPSIWPIHTFDLCLKCPECCQKEFQPGSGSCL